MTLNGIIALILPYFTEFASFGQWRRHHGARGARAPLLWEMAGHGDGGHRTGSEVNRNKYNVKFTQECLVVTKQLSPKYMYRKSLDKSRVPVRSRVPDTG